MRRNITLLANHVRDALTAKCLTAIITEAFINGLPLDREEIVAEAASFSKYSSNIISKMHPEKLLDSALESTLDNPKANLYVKNLKDEIDSVVKDATQRIVQEALIEDKPMAETLKAIKLNEQETEKLVEASKRTGTDAVAKLVKDKMIDVIKDEKESYETSAKLREEVREVLNNAKKEVNDSTLESYLDLVLSPTDPRSHISFFSKMQDVCMEALMHSNEETTSEVPFETIEKITLESTFDYFDLSNRTLLEEINSVKILSTMANESYNSTPEEKAIKMKKIAKTAFICSICIMTLLETMKTMHIAKPSVADVKRFVDTPTNIKDMATVSLAKIEDRVNDVANDVKRSVAMGAINTLELQDARKGLESVISMINNIVVDNSEKINKDRIISKIQTVIESISEVSSNENIPSMDLFVTRKKEENLAQLEHGIKITSRKPMVQEVILNIASDVKTSENSKADVEIRGVDAAGSTVSSYFVTLHTCEEFGSNLAEVIHDIVNYIDIGVKPVKLYFTDAGYSVPVKK